MNLFSGEGKKPSYEEFKALVNAVCQYWEATHTGSKLDDFDRFVFECELDYNAKILVFTSNSGRKYAWVDCWGASVNHGFYIDEATLADGSKVLVASIDSPYTV